MTNDEPLLMALYSCQTMDEADEVFVARGLSTPVAKLCEMYSQSIDKKSRWWDGIEFMTAAGAVDFLVKQLIEKSWKPWDE